LKMLKVGVFTTEFTTFHVDNGLLHHH